MLDILVEMEALDIVASTKSGANEHLKSLGLKLEQFDSCSVLPPRVFKHLARDWSSRMNAFANNDSFEESSKRLLNLYHNSPVAAQSEILEAFLLLHRRYLLERDVIFPLKDLIVQACKDYGKLCDEPKWSKIRISIACAFIEAITSDDELFSCMQDICCIADVCKPAESVLRYVFNCHFSRLS